MDIYFFVFAVEPAQSNPYEESISDADASLMVLAESQGSAEEMARRYLRKYHWLIVSLQEAALVDVREVENSHKKSMLYGLVQGYGIALLLDVRCAESLCN
ncbi:MAG: hypothetical protein GXP10_09820 [Gammaproteobacteria bacterium]|nr:hypothetical protein [Gammaproteobacteria bacterium]